MDKQRELPLFPLNTVLFPGMALPLHIFEERYKLMIKQRLQEEGTFGVVLIREGNEVGDAPKEGRSWSALESDRFLKRDASHLQSLAELFRRVRPGGEHYLTSIGTRGMRPQALESWRDDLWVFPRYPEAAFVPFDARPGGPAAAGWAKAGPPNGETASRSEGDARKQNPSEEYPLSGLPTRHVDIEAKEHDSGP